MTGPAPAAVLSAALPPAPWRDAPGLARITAALDGAVRAVGGAVRDTLVGRPAHDVDLATPLSPAEVMARLTDAGIKVVPTGLAHGTVTAVADGSSYEITTLRRDVATDGRHAEVAFTADWRADAARRDFTINALYADPVTGALWDYFGGLADLAAGRVRFIGDAATRIAEDHLRILRYFRFLARYGDAPDAAALNACTAAAPKLMTLSRERIADESLAILAAPAPAAAVALMAEGGILAAYLPEAAPDAAARLARLTCREDAAGAPPDPVRRFAALLPDGVAADAAAVRLKLSRRQRARLTAAFGDVPTVADARACAYLAGTEAVEDIALLHADDDALAPLLAAMAGWTPPRLPIGGGALVARGLTAGPRVAATLQAIERDWVAAGFVGGDALEDIVTARVAAALRQAGSAD